jgi:hypothetical protein
MMKFGNATITADFDVRPMLAQGVDPRQAVIERAGRVAPGGRFILDAPFDPLPLRTVLMELGYSSRAEKLGEDHWRVTFIRDGNKQLGAAGKDRCAGKPSNPSDVMAGAKDHLIPLSIPFRLFAAAMVFHMAGWALLALASDQLPGFVGGLGPILASLHLITLGVLTMTVMGASFQLLPVATMRPIRWLAGCRLTFWLYVPGLLSLLHGFGSGQVLPMELGGALAAAGLAVYAWLAIDLVRHAGTQRVAVLHVGVAMASLALVALLGLLMVADFDFGFLPNHRRLAVAHAVVAGYGFIGMQAMGFSFILVPMLALAPAANATDGVRSAGTAAVALALAAIGLAVDAPPLTIVAGLLGLVAAGLHLSTMWRALKARMKKRLGDAFLLLFLGWILLPVGIVIGLAAALGGGERWATLFGFLLVFGWLLSFLTGVLQRIIPFLASMHSSVDGKKPILVSRLTPVKPLRLHLVGHSLGLVLVAAGIVLNSAPLIRSGAIAGTIGATAFAWFGVTVWRRLAVHLNPNP